ncbi:flagellar hook-length control protein FliK [Arthrobacter sp. 18067]|uniref:flagellar hook-length control protein FliK n=1 Tax=Arthrobacter sp. 18067 TaxID=2681413 RepID=UPI001359BA75|nr:flagellar hook-length control protein FliK [Arthrobacter sp. 18067]
MDELEADVTAGAGGDSCAGMPAIAAVPVVAPQGPAASGTAGVPAVAAEPVVAPQGTAASGTAGVPAIATVPVVAPGQAAEVSQSARFDGSLPIRRPVPSNLQQAVETEADGPGAPVPGTQDLAADTSAHFDDSLPDRWLERRGLQGTPETGELESDVAAGAGGASSAGMPAVAAVPVVAPQGTAGGGTAGVPAVAAVPVVAPQGTAGGGTAGVPAVAAVPVVAPGQAAEVSQSGRFDGSLPVRRLVPSIPQQAVESDADGPVAPVPGTQDLAADTPVHIGASLPVRWLERHGAQGTPDTGVAALGTAGSGTAGVPAVAAVPVVAPGQAAEVSQSARFDGSLPVRWLERHGAQGTPESGAILAMPAPLTVHPAATPTTLLPTPAGTALQPTLQQPLTPQLAAPLFSLAAAGPGEHVMTLRVTPEDLGPLTVRAHIDGTGMRIELFAPGDAGREAVRHVLPELRRGLEDSGASLSLSSHNSPTDTGKDAGRDPGQGSGSATRDPGQPARREGDPRTNSPEDQPQQRRQRPPGVVHDPSSPNRLDVLV